MGIWVYGHMVIWGAEGYSNTPIWKAWRIYSFFSKYCNPAEVSSSPSFDEFAARAFKQAFGEIESVTVSKDGLYALASELATIVGEIGLPGAAVDELLSKHDKHGTGTFELRALTSLIEDHTQPVSQPVRSRFGSSHFGIRFKPVSSSVLRSRVRAPPKSRPE